MAEDIESELEAQLVSQRETLAGINEAVNLGGDSAEEGHAELLQMRDELTAAVSELESALLEIKRARILQQLAARNPPSVNTRNTLDAGPTAPPPPPPQAILPAKAGQTIPSAAASQPIPGSYCHFRYMDGRWYAGRVQGPGRQAHTVSVAFEIPTRPFMLDPVDVMEALVRPCAEPALTATSAAVAASWREGQSFQEGGGGGGSGSPLPGLVSSAKHGADVAVGRRALALLPGSRLYVPVEVVALDVTRATATVLPLLLQPQGPGGGGAGGGGGGEVVVPLALVTQHAHVTAPEEAGGSGDGGAARDNAGSGDGDGGSSSSSSVSGLLRHGTGVAESSEDDGDFDSEHEAGDDDGSGGGGDDDDLDLYGSDGDGGGGPGDFEDGAGEEMEDEDRGGIGLDALGHARLAAAAGALDDSVLLLADWEGHGRGVASRLLVRMGYVRGKGLGSRGQGLMSAPEVLLLPERKGLGAVDRDRVRRVGGGGGGGSGNLQGGVDKRRSRRGGVRQKRKRAILAASAARDEAREVEEGVPGGGGLFDFINSSLGDSSAAARTRKAQVALLPGMPGGDGGDGAGAVHQRAGAAAIAGAVAAASVGLVRRPVDRRGLMSHHDNVAGIQTKLSRLQEMLGRHKDNRGLRTQIEAQIRAVQGELAAAQAATARVSKAIHDKDAQKKWLKF